MSIEYHPQLLSCYICATFQVILQVAQHFLCVELQTYVFYSLFGLAHYRYNLSTRWKLHIILRSVLMFPLLKPINFLLTLIPKIFDCYVTILVQRPNPTHLLNENRTRVILAQLQVNYAEQCEMIRLLKNRFGWKTSNSSQEMPNEYHFIASHRQYRQLQHSLLSMDCCS